MSLEILCVKRPLSCVVLRRLFAKAITRFTYENFWPIVAKFEGDKVGGNGDRIVDKETIKDVSLMFRFLSVSL